MLRGTPSLLDRRAEVVLRALASLAVNERENAMGDLRQVIKSIDEELPVTETASHGIARARGAARRTGGGARAPRARRPLARLVMFA